MAKLEMVLTPLIMKVPTRLHHMVVAEQRGTVYFACEAQPLATLNTFGPPTKCPLCGVENPLSKVS